MFYVFPAVLLFSEVLMGQPKPLEYVNPFIGASTSVGAAGIYHGLGKTFPGAATPFGMVQVSPNTITGGDNGSGYSYEHTSIEGFALTQMSGVGWYGDLGNFLIMPTTGDLKTSAGKPEGSVKGYRSLYAKESEKASAGYYSVRLTDYNILAEMTAMPHSGMLRFTFPQNRQSRIQIDLARRVGGTSVLQDIKVVNKNTIEGWMKCTPEGGGWGNGAGQADYTVYFYAVFSKPLTDYGVWSAEIPDSWSRKLEDIESEKYQAVIAKAKVLKGVKEKQGKHLGFFTGFATTENEQVLMKAGISFVSIDGARTNLQKELPDWNFDKVHQQASGLWNVALSKIQVAGGTPEERTVFYTAMYHSMIDPRTFEDVDGRYPGGDGKAHQSTAYTRRTIFSGWDVFRSQMPLQTIINPSVTNDLIHSLIDLAEEKKKDYLERWEFLNAYSGCMIGSPAVSVIADALMKGIGNFDAGKAYDLSVNTGEKFGNGAAGFSPGGLSISNTLEYSYSDWCLSQMAAKLGNKEDAAKYSARAQAYKNVFDKEKGWLSIMSSFQGFTEHISKAAGYDPADTPTRRGKLPAVSTTPPSPGGTRLPSPAIIQPVFPITSPTNPFDQSAMGFYSPAQGSASQARATHAGAHPNPAPQVGTSRQAQAFRTSERCSDLRNSGHSGICWC